MQSNPAKKIVPIAFAFDDKMEMPAGVAITSLLLNALPETFYDVFILHPERCDFSSSKINILPTIYHNCQIHFLSVNDTFDRAFEIRGISVVTYYRLIIPELIPEYDKILYSDVDVIIREDLGRYYDLDLGENYFAGVDNCSRLRPGYYYSGNLIINSALIRRDGKMDEFRELGKNDYNQQDMDIMNIACNGRFLPLGPSYCLTNFLYELIVKKRADMEAIYGAEELDHAMKSGIVHYNGAKPWNGPCLNMDIWWDYYRRSPFFDEAFCYDFWNTRRNLLVKMPLLKRVKLLLRYPLDRR